MLHAVGHLSLLRRQRLRLLGPIVAQARLGLAVRFASLAAIRIRRVRGTLLKAGLRPDRREGARGRRIGGGTRGLALFISGGHTKDEFAARSLLAPRRLVSRYQLHMHGIARAKFKIAHLEGGEPRPVGHSATGELLRRDWRELTVARDAPRAKGDRLKTVVITRGHL